jgi:AcrR family transcriptional regulator
MAPPTRTPRATWIAAGLEALASGGPDAVKIDPLAKSLGVTRGGFYWHFDDRQALLEAMLDRWEETALEAVIERVEAGGGDHRARLRRLFALASDAREIVTIDLAVRDWSRRDAAVAERLRRVDARRLDYLRELFSGTHPDEAEARAVLTLSFWIGNHFIAARSRPEVLELAMRHLER